MLLGKTTTESIMSCTFSLVTTVPMQHVTREATMPTDTCLKFNYPEPKATANAGLPQNRQSFRLWPRKSPFESIAAPSLCKRKKQGERYLKPRALWLFSTCCRLSDTRAVLAEARMATWKLWHSFSFAYSLQSPHPFPIDRTFSFVPQTSCEKWNKTLLLWCVNYLGLR